MTKSASQTEQALAELRAYTPSDPAQQEFQAAALTLVENGETPLARTGATGHVTASAVVLREEDEAVLLTLHPKYGRWLQLGGHLEPVDTGVVAAALREASEESGLGALVVHPKVIDIDVHPVPCPGPGGHHYDVRILVIVNGMADIKISDESDDLVWFLPGMEPEGLDPALIRAITAARATLQGLSRTRATPASTRRRDSGRSRNTH